MERTDWLDAGFDPAQARFLMVTAITHHRFSSQIWGERQVRKLHAELAEIEVAVMDAIGPIRPDRHRQRSAQPLGARPVPARVNES